VFALPKHIYRTLINCVSRKKSISEVSGQLNRQIKWCGDEATPCCLITLTLAIEFETEKYENRK